LLSAKFVKKMIYGNVKTVFLIFLFIIFFDKTTCQLNDLESEIRPYQILFTEIMADPTPKLGLPENEYLEIYNNSPGNIDLAGWELLVGKTSRLLPTIVIQPNEYLILCDIEAEPLFKSYGKTLAINLPALLNQGQTLVLKSPAKRVIHAVTFSQEWYKDKSREEGGWSIEIIDIGNPCGGFNNWTSAISPVGGTPGALNSVTAINSDNNSPKILRATLPSDSSLMLYFSEPLNPETLQSPSAYSVSNGFLHPKSVFGIEPEFSQVMLSYPVRFKTDVIYSLSVLNSLKDCALNSLADNAFIQFAPPKPLESFDVVINEILFNPANEASEFIEFYNRSDKVVDFCNFRISLANQESLTIGKTVSFATQPFLLFPDNYLVITKNARNLPHQFLKFHPEAIIENKELFSLPDEAGIIVLADSTGIIIDELQYDQRFHAPILDDDEGVSLERVNPDLSTSDPDNWCSASTKTGYCTPGMRNSQLNESEKIEFTAYPDYFSPDEDGSDDVLTVHLVLNEPGWVGTIMVYNMKGQCIKNLISNSLLGTDLLLSWDGTDYKGVITNIGPYLLYAEIYSPTGKFKKFKKVISLVGKYNR
jgi:hypothetical protein